LSHLDRRTKRSFAAAVLGSYLSYWTNKAVKHQRCNAHLLRDLQAVLSTREAPASLAPRLPDDFAGQSGDPGAWAGELQSLILATKAKRAAAKDGVLTPRQYALARNAMTSLAQRGLATHPEPANKEVRSYQIDSNARALANRIVKHIDEYLTYTRDPQVPFTNNEAEGAVRHAKVKQRRSGIHRSLEAAKEYARIRSYLETGRKHGEDSARVVEALAGGHPWFPPGHTAPTR
jgi:transposase